VDDIAKNETSPTGTAGMNKFSDNARDKANDGPKNTHGGSYLRAHRKILTP
jgi:hypothetical protein